MPGDEFSRSVRRRSGLLALSSLIVAIVAGLVAHSSAPQYVSSASFLVGPVSSPDVDTLRAAQSLTSTYSQLILSPVAVQTVAQRLLLSPASVNSAADVNFNTDTRIVTLTVTSRRPADAKDITRELTTELTALVGSLGPTSPGKVKILSTLPPTAVPVKKSALRYALLGGAGWLLLALGALAALTAGRPGASKDPEQGELGQRALNGPAPVGVPPIVPIDSAPSRAETLSSRDVEQIAERVSQRLLESLQEDDGSSRAQR